MSKIYSFIFALFLPLSILAIRAPPDVYSAIVKNLQDKQVQCYFVWSDASEGALKQSSVTLGNSQEYSTGENLVSKGTWTARAAIEEIRCGDLVVRAPFDKVDSPKTNWIFHIEADRIVSVGHT